MSNEPVAIGGIISIITAVLTPILIKHGIDAAGTAKIFGYVPAIISAVVSVYSVINARSKVTPVVKVPKAADPPAV